MSVGRMEGHDGDELDPPPPPSPEVAATLGLDRPEARRRRSTWVVSAAILLIASLVFLRALSARDAGPIYRTESTAQAPLLVTIGATGALAPVNEVDVGTEISGIVESVLVDFNDVVRPGQVLARVNTDKLDASTAQARASLALAQAQLAEARASVLQAESDIRRLRRVHELSNGEVPSEAELDASQAAYDRAVAQEAKAEAQIAQSQATLDAFLTDLARATVISPISGVVLDRRVEPGQTVAAAFQTPVLFTLAGDLREMELSVALDEADVGVVEEGQEATFTVDAYPDRVFSATVVEVRYSPENVGGVVTYETILSVDNGDLLLRPGMTATADIVVGHVADALLIPNAALRFTPSVERDRARADEDEGLIQGLLPRPGAPIQRADLESPRVWVLRDGRPVAVDLTVGATDGTWTEVVAGELVAGDVVITDELEERG